LLLKRRIKKPEYFLWGTKEIDVVRRLLIRFWIQNLSSIQNKEKNKCWKLESWDLLKNEWEKIIENDILVIKLFSYHFEQLKTFFLNLRTELLILLLKNFYYSIFERKNISSCKRNSKNNRVLLRNSRATPVLEHSEKSNNKEESSYFFVRKTKTNKISLQVRNDLFRQTQSLKVSLSNLTKIGFEKTFWKKNCAEDLFKGSWFSYPLL